MTQNFDSNCEKDIRVFYIQAIDEKERHDWIASMQDEILFSISEVCTLARLPERANAVQTKWSYNCNIDMKEKVNRHKSRFEAEEFTQIEGIDYFDLFSSQCGTPRSVMSLYHFLVTEGT